MGTVGISISLGSNPMVVTEWFLSTFSGTQPNGSKHRPSGACFTTYRSSSRSTFQKGGQPSNQLM